MTQPNTHTGFISIIGRPNVGKSTLLNHLIGQKISIVSRKAQTTRHRITGIRTDEATQYVFVDTPGFQLEHTNALNRAMNRTVTQALKDVDVVLFVVEVGRFGPKDQKVLDMLPQNTPVILVVNKIDRLANKQEILPFLMEMGERFPFRAMIPVSATHSTGFEDLLTEIRALLPEAPFCFDEDDITDRSERFLAAEILREKIFRLSGEEIPYSVSVEIEKFELDGALRRIYAAIIVDKTGHKPILIGNKGEKLKRIATEARLDMEKLFDGKVYLEVFVKVKSGWADDERAIKSLGYE